MKALSEDDLALAVAAGLPPERQELIVPEFPASTRTCPALRHLRTRAPAGRCGTCGWRRASGRCGVTGGIVFSEGTCLRWKARS